MKRIIFSLLLLMGVSATTAFGQIATSGEGNFNKVAETLIQGWFTKTQKLELEHTRARQIKYVIGVHVGQWQVTRKKANAITHVWHFAMDMPLPIGQVANGRENYAREVIIDTWENWFIIHHDGGTMLIPWRVEANRIVGDFVDTDGVKRPIYIQPTKD